MQSHSSTSPLVETIPIKKGLAVLSGYGLSVGVRHGRLHVQDGIGASRREARYSKATSGLFRLVILGHSGTISLSALRWLYDAKAAVVHVDADGNIVVASSPLNERDNALRRAQILARDTEGGNLILAKLLTDKIEGEARVAALIGPEWKGKVAAYSEFLREARTIDGMRVIESRAAAEYWNAWSEVPLKFARRDLAKVPSHWQTFGTRVSPLTHSPRNAANPANALFNYLYAILEAETRIALLTIGLDPGLGLMHADQLSRDSLACDVMEAVRPLVDEWLLGFLSETVFAARDFFERPDGSVRLTRDVAQRLAETTTLWRRAVSPEAEWLATELLRTLPRGVRASGRPPDHRPPTRLTQANRSAGREAVRMNASSRQRPPRSAVSRTCPECGKPVTSTARRFCSKRCWQSYNDALVVPRLAKAGPNALAECRSRGADPGHGGVAASRRGQTQRCHARERKDWESLGLNNEDEKNRFSSEILPQIVHIPIRQIARATGWTPYYASLVRRGLRVPHPVHYPALRRLLDEIS